MPDDFRISDLPTSASFNNLDLMEVSQVDEHSLSGYTSVKKTMNQIGDKLNNSIEYAIDLNTTDKKIIGAINEVNQKIEYISIGGNTTVTRQCGYGTIVFMVRQSIGRHCIYMIDGWGSIEPIIESHQDLTLSYSDGTLTIVNTTTSGRSITLIKT